MSSHKLFESRLEAKKRPARGHKKDGRHGRPTAHDENHDLHCSSEASNDSTQQSNSHGLGILSTSTPSAWPARKHTPVRDSRREAKNLTPVAALQYLTKGAYEWLEKELALEGLSIDGTVTDEDLAVHTPDDSLPSSFDIPSFSPKSPPLPLFPAPLIIEGCRESRPSDTTSGGHGIVFNDQVVFTEALPPEGQEFPLRQQPSDPNTTPKAPSISSTYEFLDRIEKSFINDTGIPSQGPQQLALQSNPRDVPQYIIGNDIALYLDRLDSAGDGHTFSRYPSFARTAGHARGIKSHGGVASKVAAHSTQPIPGVLKGQASEPAVNNSQTVLATPMRRRAHTTADQTARKSKFLLPLSSSRVGKILTKAVKLVPPRPRLSFISSISRPRTLSSPDPTIIDSQVPSNLHTLRPFFDRLELIRDQNLVETRTSEPERLRLDHTLKEPSNSSLEYSSSLVRISPITLSRGHEGEELDNTATPRAGGIRLGYPPPEFGFTRDSMCVGDFVNCKPGRLSVTPELRRTARNFSRPSHHPLPGGVDGDAVNLIPEEDGCHLFRTFSPPSSPSDRNDWVIIAPNGDFPSKSSYFSNINLSQGLLTPTNTLSSREEGHCPSAPEARAAPCLAIQPSIPRLGHSESVSGSHPTSPTASLIGFECKLTLACYSMF